MSGTAPLSLLPWLGFEQGRSAGRGQKMGKSLPSQPGRANSHRQGAHSRAGLRDWALFHFHLLLQRNYKEQWLFARALGHAFNTICNPTGGHFGSFCNVQRSLVSVKSFTAHRGYVRIYLQDLIQMGPHNMLWRREASPHFASKES